MNGKKIWGWGGCLQLLYNIRGFQKCYTVLYRVGVVKNFQFLRYIIYVHDPQAPRPYYTWVDHRWSLTSTSFGAI